MKTPIEIYALLEDADPVTDAATLDTSALVARIETELGDSAATSSAVPIREESITPTSATAQPITSTPGRRWWQGPAVAISTAVIIIGAVLGVAAAAGWLGAEGDVEPDVANTGITPTTTTIVTPTTEALPPAVFTLSAAPDVDPVVVSTVVGDLEFTTLQFPPADFDYYYEVAATPYGPVALEDSTLWWSTDYQTWEGKPVSSPVNRVTVVGDDVVVYAGRAATRLVWDGTGWTEQAQLDLLGTVNQVVFGPQGAVAVGYGIYYSTDQVNFAKAERGPSNDVFVAAENVPEEDRDFGDCRRTATATVSRINTVLATDAGFVALTSAAHPDDLICAPLLWFSADGNTWDLVSHDSPFGKMAIVNAADPWGIAERNGRFVATGSVGGQGREEEQAAVWVSDDGLTWQQVDGPGRGGDVAAGELGWMLTGEAGPEGASYPAMWFSTDGLTWDGPHDLPQGLTGLRSFWRLPLLAVGSDAVFGVGTLDSLNVLVVGRLQD